MKTLCLIGLLAAAVAAAPVLRLSNTVIGGTITVGSSLGSQTLEAYNVGDGTLSLTVWIPAAVNWVSAKVGAETCTLTSPPGPCTPIQFTFTTSALAQGTYTATASIFDPHAQDSPQVVIVAVTVGDPQTGLLEGWMVPGAPAYEFWGASCSSFRFPECSVGGSATTADGGRWLYLTVNDEGSSGGHVEFAAIYMAPPPTLPDGTYNGLANTLPVTLHVASPPYAVATPSQLSVSLAQGGPAVGYPFIPAIAMGSQSTPVVAQAVTASGAGVTASASNGLVLVSIDPGTLAAGSYPNTGSLTIQCNAVNCPVQVPVSLQIEPRGPPVINWVVDNASFASGATLAQGDIAVVQGEQLSLSPAAFAPSGPLPATLADATVLVNGKPAPLFYSSFGQIAFQMPSAASGTVSVQVERSGQMSNTAPVAVASRAPSIAALTGTSFNVVDLAHPAKAGDVIIVWAIGVGPTNPAMADGTPSPASPLAQVVSPPLVQIGGVSISPCYAVMTPGYVGLYQIAAPVPQNASGNISVKLVFPEISSNTVGLAVH
ncbi:MAG TPA: hypothetical protein VML19_06235 [Verrucomicrobiae bacterium]|nr:hypothetical protein [Verrucomicrobiae bacterium]